MINKNKLAKRVAEEEGGKYNMTIAQVKECMRQTFLALLDYEDYEIIKMLARQK